jgi:hypothetical protein
MVDGEPSRDAGVHGEMKGERFSPLSEYQKWLEISTALALSSYFWHLSKISLDIMVYQFLQQAQIMPLYVIKR